MCPGTDCSLSLLAPTQQRQSLSRHTILSSMTWHWLDGDWEGRFWYKIFISVPFRRWSYSELQTAHVWNFSLPFCWFDSFLQLTFLFWILLLKSTEEVQVFDAAAKVKNFDGMTSTFITYSTVWTFCVTFRGRQEKISFLWMTSFKIEMVEEHKHVTDDN